MYSACPPVMCGLKDDVVEVSGGGLGYGYSTLQLHFHWGTAQASGSEHTVDSKRYLMEVGTVAALRVALLPLFTFLLSF